METHAFGFRLPANAPEGQKRFPISFDNYVEEEITVIRKLLGAAAAALLLVSSFAHAEIPWTLIAQDRLADLLRLKTLSVVDRER
jgi:hypothetical protein